MKTQSDYRPVELGMRIMEVVRTHASAHPNFMMSDLSEVLSERFNISRATCFRHMRTALDVLCIPYDEGTRRPRICEKIAEGIDRAKACRHPKGKSGRPTAHDSPWSRA